MRNFTRYVLALSVLAAGVYGASRFKLPPEDARSSDAGKSTQLISAATPDAIPLVPRTSRKPPLAVLIDTDRTLSADLPPDSRTTLKTLPGIARRESEEEPSISSGDSASETPHRPKRNKSRISVAEAPAPTELPSSAEKDAATMPVPRRNQLPLASAETKPAVEPIAPGATPGAPADPPLPKLDPRPGNRFLVPDPFASPADPPSNGADYVDVSETQSAPEKNGTSSVAASPETPVESGDPDPRPRRHRIIAGDTLPKLAARYLGDAVRYLEIFRANEQLLVDPRLLPIGLEIDIPSSATPTAENAPDDSPTTDVPLDEDPLDALFRESTVSDEPEHAESDLEPIPPQSLPPPDFGAWRYSPR